MVLAFFSYSHHDADTDPALFDALSAKLVKLVNSRLINEKFALWRDTYQLRTGTLWNERIEDAIANCDIFIIALSPKWLDSSYCLKEYDIFCRTCHGSREYKIIPILIRDVDRQEKYFNKKQREIFETLTQHQYFRADAASFADIDRPQQHNCLELIADDLEGAIARIRDRPIEETTPIRRTLHRQREFSGTPHDYNQVDLVSAADVEIRSGESERTDIFAQIDFAERLFVQGEKARIEFGVRRAYLSVEANTPPSLKRIELPNSPNRPLTFVRMRERPDAVSVCIDPDEGRHTLTELSLPVTEGDNRMARIATGTKSISPENLKATLSVSLTTTDLTIRGEKNGTLSNAAKEKIAAIMKVAISKTDWRAEDGRILRELQITDKRT